MTERGLPARRKGHQYERVVAKYLNTVTTRSSRPGTHEDAGDIVLPGWCVEIRNRAKWSVELWFQLIEHKTLPDDHPLLILHRAGKPTRDSLVVMRLEEFASLIKEGSTA